MLRRSERIRSNKRLKGGGGEEVSSPNVEDASELGVAIEGGVATDGTVGTAGPSSGKNPLEISVVLNHLFELCPAELIATCRLVCKQWYKESLAAWRTNSTLTIGVRDSRNRQLLYKERIPMLNQFLEYVQNPENKCSKKPYRRIKIKSCEFGSRPPSQPFEMFWNVLGPNLTTLILYDFQFNSVEEFRKIVYTCCPNIQCLELLKCTFHGENSALARGWKGVEYEAPLYGEHKNLKSVKIDFGYYNDLPVSWLEFFSHFPSLTLFEIKSYERLLAKFCAPQFTKVTEAIRAIRRENVDKLPLNFFSIHPALRISHVSKRKQELKIARELHLPLDTLCILDHPKLKFNFLKSTLNFYANTVKNIHAFLDVDKHNNDLTTPTTLLRNFPFGLQLQNLEYFEILYKLCESFTFLKYMPNLKRLDVVSKMNETTYNPVMFTTTSAGVSNTPKHEMDHVKMLKLTKLKVNCVVSSDDAKSLIQWMPNVEELIMVLNDKQFGIICGGWKHLKKIEVRGYKLTDLGILGTKLEANGEDEDASVSPNITDLQKYLLAREDKEGTQEKKDRSTRKDALTLAVHSMLLEGTNSFLCTVTD